MTNAKKTLIFISKDPIMTAAFIAAAVSTFFIRPSLDYVAYIDGHVLSLLLSMMLVVAGFQKVGIFDIIVNQLLRFVKDVRTLAFVLIGICFFSSMLITNDVALITFVPLSIILLTQTHQHHLLIPIIVMQTIAANLGSMFTPLGNPQNLYLFSISNMTIFSFLEIMFLPTLLSFLLITAVIFLIKPTSIQYVHTQMSIKKDEVETLFWLIMFAFCLLAVLKIMPYTWVLGIIIIGVILIDRQILFNVDYGLLMTFIFLFIFIGNLKAIPQISSALGTLVGGHEIAVGILLSQVLSNVPAAMLLSKFTLNYSDLLIGVNLGGLGTLIASMASVISFKYYASTIGAKTGKYLMVFTLANLFFLAILWAVFSGLSL